MQNNLTVKVKKFYHDAQLPFKKHSTDGCYDVYAHSLEIKDGVYYYGLGIGLELPPQTEMMIRPRTSIAKTGMVLANSPGTGDEGFTGEYTLAFYHVQKNLAPYKVGDRIAQIQIRPRWDNEFIEVDEFVETERGSGKFGSTGK